MIKILTQFGLENYGLKVGKTLKIFVNIALFLVSFFSPNCADTSRRKCVNTLRPQSVNPSSKQCEQWKCQDCQKLFLV